MKFLFYFLITFLILGCGLNSFEKRGKESKHYSENLVSTPTPSPTLSPTPSPTPSSSVERIRGKISTYIQNGAARTVVTSNELLGRTGKRCKRTPKFIRKKLASVKPKGWMLSSTTSYMGKLNCYCPQVKPGEVNPCGTAGNYLGDVYAHTSLDQDRISVHLTNTCYAGISSDQKKLFTAEYEVECETIFRRPKKANKRFWAGKVERLNSSGYKEFGSSEISPTYSFLEGGGANMRPWIGISPWGGSHDNKQTSQKLKLDRLRVGQKYQLTVFTNYSSSLAQYNARVVSGKATLENASQEFGTRQERWDIDILAGSSSVTIELGNDNLSGTHYLYFDAITIAPSILLEQNPCQKVVKKSYSTPYGKYLQCNSPEPAFEQKVDAEGWALTRASFTVSHIDANGLHFWSASVQSGSSLLGIGAGDDLCPGDPSIRRSNVGYGLLSPSNNSVKLTVHQGSSACSNGALYIKEINVDVWAEDKRDECYQTGIALNSFLKYSPNAKKKWGTNLALGEFLNTSLKTTEPAKLRVISVAEGSPDKAPVEKCGETRVGYLHGQTILNGNALTWDRELLPPSGGQTHAVVNTDDIAYVGPGVHRAKFNVAVDFNWTNTWTEKGFGDGFVAIIKED